MLISEAYRASNAELHAREASYGSHAHTRAPAVRQLVKDNGFKTVLDYGCGKGTLAAALDGIDVREYDPAIPGKDGEPEPADLVACFDVLEHVEPELLDSVLDHIHGLTKHMLVFVISTIPSGKTLADGRNAHLIVKPADWWRKQLGNYFDLIAWRVDASAVVGCGTPRY
ncbi:MAG TPA: methyltransferase domain-containing protein [Salinarimonas sp.]|nr:methyltransferase domain-containing protein [Salinarimonas sp.]